MTPVLWLDPVAAAAIAAGLTPAVGLGQLVCANDCARFGGKVPGHTRGSNWDWVPCPDCRGTGLVQPSGPTTMLIGATAVKPGKVGDWMMVPPSSVVTNGEWIAQRWEGSTCVERLRILPASILGTATVAIPPIYDEPPTSSEQAVWIDVSTGSPLMICWNGNEWEELPEYRDRLSAALPFGSWEPGGLAAIFTDLTPRIDTTGDLWRCSCPVDCCRGIGPDPGGCGWCWAKETEDPCPSAAAPIGPLSWSDAPTSPCITTIDLKENAA